MELGGVRVAKLEGEKTSDLAPSHLLRLQPPPPNAVVRGRLRQAGAAPTQAKSRYTGQGATSGESVAGKLLLRDYTK